MQNSIITSPKVRFSEFSEPWFQVKLGNIGSFKNGLNKGSEDFGHGFPFINLLDVFGKIEIDEPELKLVNASQRDLDTYTVKKGDVFFIRSSVKRSGVGQTVVANKNLENTVYSGFLIRYRTDKDLTDSFKKYCFWTEKFRNLLVKYSTSSANTNINQESLQNLTLSIPSAKEQQKIANFLSTIDKQINLLKEKHTLLVKYKKGVIQKLFAENSRFKDDDGTEFPDWKTERIDYFVERVSDPVDVQPDKIYREIGVRSHGKGIFHKKEIKGHELGNKRVFWVHQNAFVVNIVFAWEHAVAKTSERETGFIASHRFPMFIPREQRVDLRFFTIFFLSKRGKYLLGLASPGGAGRNKTLGQSNFSELKVKFPVLEEQIKIANFYEALDKKVKLAEKQIEQTQTFKKGLLQQMFV